MVQPSSAGLPQPWTYLQRCLVAAACLALGFLFFPMFFLGGFILWTVYNDIKAEPQRRVELAQVHARLNEPVGAEEIDWHCESPAERAFLKTMIAHFNLQPGPGALEGSGLRLRNQVGLGRLKIHSRGAFREYRADFVIDEKLVVEIDGAAYHSSPQAIACDRSRDEDLMRAGYFVLRIPATTVFQSPAEVVKLVQGARSRLIADVCANG